VFSRTEKRIERLESELEEAKRSPGMGMALSYYYNFIIPTAANIRKDEPTPVDIEISRGNNVNSMMKSNHILVYLPRDLDGADLKALIRNMLNDKKIIQGRPVEKAGGATHRPMFVYFLDWNTESKTCDGMFDIPTIISSCWDRAKDQKELEVNIRQELIDFQNNLYSLIKKNPVTADCVKIVSVPINGLEINSMKVIAAAINRG